MNAAAVLAGGAAGLLLRRALPQRLSEALLGATGLFTLALGARMALAGDNPLVLIASLFLGALTGEALRLEQRVEARLTGTRPSAEAHPVSTDAAHQKTSDVGPATVPDSAIAHSDSAADNTSLAPADAGASPLLTAFLIFCAGPLTVLGAIDEGLRGDPTLLLTKSVLDLSTAAILAASLGRGVLLSAVPLLIFQLGITAIAAFSAAGLSEAAIAALTASGGVLVLGLGLNLLGVTRLRILNLLPALLWALPLAWAWERWSLLR